MSRQTLHLRDLRLYVNAGMVYPHCYANAKLLDLDKSRLLTTSDKNRVTCKRCVPDAPMAAALFNGGAL